MKNCPKCNAVNTDTANYCFDCGYKFSNPTSLSTIQIKADIMFVLDCTASMKGEIEGLKDAIIDFANLIESEGIPVRVGLVAFRDRLINEEHSVLKFNGAVFTDDPKLFKSEVAKLRATGGGDIPESSLDALMFALSQPFDVKANKVIVLITDAGPHIPDKDTKSIEEVCDQFDKIGIFGFYSIIPAQDESCQIYNRLYQQRQGMGFHLGKGDEFVSRREHFIKTLKFLGQTVRSTIQSTIRLS